MDEEPIDLKETEEVVEEESKKPMGAGSADKETDVLSEEKTNADLKEEKEDTTHKNVAWYYWPIVFIAGAVAGFILGVVLV